MPGGKRRKQVRARGPRRLYVVAGLPQAVHGRALAAMSARFDEAIIKGIPATSGERALYPQPYVDQLVRSVGEFVIRRRGNGHDQPAPTSVTLLFVPSFDQDLLLRTFDFTVMLAPLTPLAARDALGQQLRHHLGTAEEALSAALSRESEARRNLETVERRLAYRSDNEALLLPPRNFYTDEGDLRPVFRRFLNGQRAWTDRLSDYGPTPLKHEDVPDRIQAQQTRRPFVDSRGVAFFTAHPTAYDGVARELDDGPEPAAILRILRSLYRFGGALEPGFHHDAQRSDGSPLGGATMRCAEKGRIQCDADYANIYPNDFVRVANFTTIDR